DPSSPTGRSASLSPGPSASTARHDRATSPRSPHSLVRAARSRNVRRPSGTTVLLSRSALLGIGCACTRFHKGCGTRWTIWTLLPVRFGPQSPRYGESEHVRSHPHHEELVRERTCAGSGALLARLGLGAAIEQFRVGPGQWPGDLQRPAIQRSDLF